MDMANPEHVEVVRQGAKAIAEWRRSNPTVRLDLSGAHLWQAQLLEADLSGADVSRANLFEADLSRADLSGAALPEANLSGADLLEARLTGADLTRANLSWANLALADLRGANLTGADLRLAFLPLACLADARLTRADLRDAFEGYSDLTSAKFAGARIGRGSLAGLDLSKVNGLATVTHGSPSSVGVDTLIASVRGAGGYLTPELRAFFRSAGVPGELLDALPAIAAKVKYHTCFIAYGQPDVAFARTLCGDLESRGVSCWLYEMHATPGRRVWTEIVGKRREAEKFVVLCSAKALVRDGVLKEIEEQVDEDVDKLMPVSLDNDWREPGFKVMRGNRDLKLYLLERNYADFANLEYEEALERLLTGLRRTP